MSSTDTPLGASTRIFLAYGAAGGVWVVEKSNWTGKALMAPRTRYKDLRPGGGLWCPLTEEVRCSTPELGSNEEPTLSATPTATVPDKPGRP